MSRPTEGTETPRLSATSGSMPMTTNSVVPMPKAPMARASRARGTGGLQAMWGGAAGSVVLAGARYWRTPGPKRLDRPVLPERRRGSAHTARDLAGAEGDTPPQRSGPARCAASGPEQHLDRAVLLLAEVRVGLRGLLERHVVGGEVVDTQRVALGEDRQDVGHPAPHVGLAHAQLD